MAKKPETFSFKVKLKNIEVRFKDVKGNDREYFEASDALAVLILSNVVFLNCYGWKDEWPVEARRAVAPIVNCNDIFAWGCADGEELPYHEIYNLWNFWRKDPIYGSAIWCMIRRNEMPQKPVERDIRKAGIWDLDALNLGKNVMDDQVKAMMLLAFGKPPATTSHNAPASTCSHPPIDQSREGTTSP
jgi:hypothetical protein